MHPISPWTALLLAAWTAQDGAPEPKAVTIRTVQEEMRYDVREFTVRAGQPVKLTLKNDDFMPHNLIVVMPGAAEEVALAAEALGAKGFEVHFKPDHPKVLHATKMLDYEEEETLAFVAPKKPGDYDYVCTFPKHWMMMRGVMHVVGEDGAPADGGAKPLPARHAWRIEELAGDLPALDRGRSFENGKAVFRRLGCLLCHRIRDEGGAVGPELTGVFKKWKGRRADVLHEILDPSRNVEEKYRASRIRKTDGAALFGLVTARAKDHLMIVTNPAEPVPVRVRLEDIETEKRSDQSPMPKGLLDTLKKAEILDLLAFLEAGGSPDHPVYASNR